MYDPAQLADQPILKNMSVGYKKPKTNVKTVSKQTALKMGHKTK